MRPVERIKPILELLEEAWHQNPDWRLGQLITNAGYAGMDDHRVEPFHVEDDKMLSGLERVVAR